MQTEQYPATVTVTLTREEYHLVRLAVGDAIDAHSREAQKSWEAADPYCARLSEQSRDKFRTVWRRLWEAANL